MNVKDFPEKNKTYIAEGCNDLPAFDNGEVIISCWSLDEFDKKCAVFFGEIWLTIWGNAQPPVRLVSRYDNAERILLEAGSPISGRRLLETINFLTEAEVTPSS